MVFWTAAGVALFFLILIAMFIAIFASTIRSRRREEQWGAEEWAQLVAPSKAEERERRVAEERDRALSQVVELARSHAIVLSRKYHAHVDSDDYGTTDFNLEGWRKDIDYFVERVVRQALGFGKNSTLWSDARFRQEVYNIIVIIATNISSQGELGSEEISKMSGYEFEHHCALLLRESGFEVTVTQASGDQGVDIVAKKNGDVMAVQCKRQESPVGNKAVQEVSSGRRHYGAHYAVVVTNSTFTQAAKELARTNDVFLCHVSELGSLPFPPKKGQ